MTGIALTFELRKFGKFGPNLVRRRVGGLRYVHTYVLGLSSILLKIRTYVCTRTEQYSP